MKMSEIINSRTLRSLVESMMYSQEKKNKCTQALHVCDTSAYFEH